MQKERPGEQIKLSINCHFVSSRSYIVKIPKLYEDRTDSVRARYRMEVFSFRVGCFLVGYSVWCFNVGLKVAATVVQQTLDSGKSKRVIFGPSL
jgi:hypothetical protein